MKLLPFFLVFFLFLSGEAQAQKKGKNWDSTYNAYIHLEDEAYRAFKVSELAYAYSQINGEKALLWAQQALELANRLGEEKTALSSQITIAMVKGNQMKTDEAVGLFLDVIRKLKETAYDTLTARAYYTLAHLYIETKDYSNALTFQQQALDKYRELNWTAREMVLLDAMGTTYRSLNQYKKAEEYHLKAIEMVKKMRDGAPRLCIFYGNLAIVYNNLENYKKAIYYIDMAGRIHDSLGSQRHSSLYSNRAKANLHLGNYPEAEKDIQAAFKLIEKEGNTAGKLGALDIQAEIDASQRNFESAYINQLKKAEINDSIFNSEKSLQIAEMQTRFETELKDEKIHSQGVEISKNEQFLVGIAIVAFLLLLSSGTVFYAYRRSKKLNREITLQRSELQKLSNTQQVMFSVISHDLRKPIHSLHTVVNVLGMEADYSHKMPKYIQVLSESLATTEGLVDNLLHWTQTQMKGYVVSKTNEDVGDLFRENLLLFKKETEAKKISITYSPETPFMVFTDFNMLRINLRNLIHNAVKFTPSEGNIHLSAERQEDMLKITIRDTGVGMDETNIARIRDTSQLYTTPGTNRESGTGLGLSLCFELVALLKGNIDIQSSKENGSTFTMTIPLAA